MHRIFFCIVTTVVAVQQLPRLDISKNQVVIAGFGHSADFAHQFHIAFSSLIKGSCIFSGQPFHGAVSHFSQDSLRLKTPWTRVPNCDGCLPSTTLAFDHCKTTPNVVDIGSLVDYPRRHCGQNPITVKECFDDVDNLKSARVFVFRGKHDEIYLPGSVENTVGLLAQLLVDPASTMKVVIDQAFSHTFPLKSTPYVNRSVPSGYDGPGECLHHVFNISLHVGYPNVSNWMAFDQTEFADKGVGFQDQGWLYTPIFCKARSCKLVIRPDKCSPPMLPPDFVHFAAHAEANGIVLLCPCVGGPVDRSKYPHAHDVEQGKLDVYGQLSADYVQQSAPHMKAIGKMVRRVLGIAQDTHQHIPSERKMPMNELASSFPGLPRKLPNLEIDRLSIMIAGCSNTADFAHQFHVAFSSLVTGSCIFSGQPFHCAVTRFAKDYLVPKSPSTVAGMHCLDCPENGTLIYDHCKNHPHWVDIDLLASYAEDAADVDDPIKHLADARVFAFGPTHDRCYQPPAMENVAAFHRRYARNASQVRLVSDQPFPHTLPTNSTPYYNHSNPAGYDGPGECLRHLIGHSHHLVPALSSMDKKYWMLVDVAEFVTDTGVGMFPWAWLFLPPPCKSGKCKLLILPGGCQPFIPPGGSDDDFARYAIMNQIVILKPCAGRPVDGKRFPHSHENMRGMVDVYGQLTPEYATQKGSQMEPIGNMLQRLLGIDRSVFV